MRSHKTSKKSWKICSIWIAVANSKIMIVVEKQTLNQRKSKLGSVKLRKRDPGNVGVYLCTNSIIQKKIMKHVIEILYITREEIPE